MNYAKKLLNKKVLYLVLFGVILIICIIFSLLQIRNSKKIEFVIIQENYSYVRDEENPLSLQINCSRNDTMYFNKKLIKNCSFIDYENYDSFLVELIDIDKQNKNMHYQDKIYYSYQLLFKLPFSSNEVIKLNNFYLKMEYVNDEKITLPMGTIALAANQYTGNAVIISSMQGIVNKSNDSDTLVGIVLKTNSLNNIEITNIKTVSTITEINLEEIKEITNEKIINDKPIEEILEKEYDIYDVKLTPRLNRTIEIGKMYVLPLMYRKAESIKTLAIIIKYFENGEELEQIVYPFKFFSGNQKMNVKKIVYDGN